MASPISAGEVLAVAKFAVDLFKACKASKGEFDQIAKEVWAMRTVIELAHLDCENPRSILNVTDTKEKSNRKALSVHIRNCKQALKDVDACLKRYRNLSGMDILAWVWSGHDEVKALESNLSSFATRLDGFINGLTLKGVGAVYEGIGRIEEALEKMDGNENLAVKEVMQQFNSSKMAPESIQRYKSIISDYAKEVSQSTNFSAPMAPTPETRGRKNSTGTLSVPATKRAKSATTSKGTRNLDAKRNASTNTKSPTKTKPKATLECWLVQVKSGHLSFLTWEFSEKEIQCRGQWKLDEMARQFKSSKKSSLNDDHDLISWVLKDRNKDEKDSQYTWQPYSAKLEQKGSLMLNLGIEEQAMVIIKRELTVEIHQKINKNKQQTQATTEAARMKAKKEVTEQKAKEASAKKAKDKKENQGKAEEELTEKKEQIKTLERENERLKKRVRDDTAKKVKDEAAKKPKDEAAKKSKDNTSNKTKDKSGNLTKDDTATKAKDDAVREQKDKTTRATKDDLSKKVKDNAAKEAKPDAAQNSKEQTTKKEDKASKPQKDPTLPDKPLNS